MRGIELIEDGLITRRRHFEDDADVVQPAGRSRAIEVAIPSLGHHRRILRTASVRPNKIDEVLVGLGASGGRANQEQTEKKSKAFSDRFAAREFVCLRLRWLGA